MSLHSPAPGHAPGQGFAGTSVFEAPGWIERDAHGPYKGRRMSFTGGVRQQDAHLAVDYPCPVGTQLVAPLTGIIVAQGTVARFPDGSLDGEIFSIVRVRRTPTYQTLYLLTHLSKFQYPIGTKVVAEKPIALSGNSGRSTDPHVHFELAVLTADANPLLFWASRYYRYNPARFMSGQDMASSELIVFNL